MRLPDVTKAHNFLEFEATTSLDTILDEVVPWVVRMVDEEKI